MVNRIILSGIVYKTPIRKVSPSGISHYQFILEHFSIQQEAGFARQARCKLPVVVSGKYTLSIASNIERGMQITAQGFISCHKGRNGFSKIVLHAKQINLLNFGD